MSLDGLPDVLAVPDVARVLRIGRNQAYELVRSRTIPSVRIGRSIRVPRTALERFLAAEVIR